jgi:hypothetical protein
MATSSTLKVPEKAARRLLKELNYDGVAKFSAKKLEKQLLDVHSGLNGETIEEMDLSNPSKSLLEEVVEAIEDEKTLKVIVAEAEVEEEEEEEVAPKKKKGTKSVKTKTPKKGTSVKEKTKTKKKKSAGSSNYNPEYADKRRNEDITLEKLITSKGPISIDNLIAKSGYPESRVRSHIKGWKRRKSGNPFYKTNKKNQVSLAE